MARPLWSGSISFGLVQIPVGLTPAVTSAESLSFTLLDKADNAPIGYKQVNKVTGEEVPKERRVKGYEVAKNEYVLIQEDDFKRANVKATETIDIHSVHWLAPRIVVEVAYGSVTSGGMLRHASFQGLRHDKDVDDVPAQDSPKEGAKNSPKKGAKNSRKEGAKNSPKKGAPETAMSLPTKARSKMGAIEVAGVTVTNAGREIYDGGITKGMLAEYIAAVAPLMLPYIEHRPLSVVRCPGGSKGKCFFQKHTSPSMPASVKSIVVPGGIRSKDDDDNVALAVDDAAGLVGLVQMGALEIHPWGAAPKDPEVPDRIIFDLDPADGLGWSRVCNAARDVREHLKRDGLVAFVKSTGGKGLHVEAPLTAGTATWDDVKTYARALADRMAAESPANYTSNPRKDARKGRTFIDYLRNGRGATAIAPYSMRAKAPTVAVPLHWDELDDFELGSVTVLTLHERLAQQETKPWARYLTTMQTLPG